MDLAQTHISPGRLASGVDTLEISHPLAGGRIALQGAQLLHWQPAGAAPVLWCTHREHTQRGRSVRGGVPICWPWFGPGGAGQGAHGFARGRDWTLHHASSDATGVHLQLRLRDDAQSRSLWDHAFELSLDLCLGATLDMALSTHNTGSTPMHLTQALHSYFSCGDIARTEVLGLEDTPYVDKVRGGAVQIQRGPVRFAGETDRVFDPCVGACHIDDHAQGRRIAVVRTGSRSAVVWNPGLEKATALGDMDPGEFRQMLCLEPANAGTDTVRLEPGAVHTLGMRVSVEPLNSLANTA